MDELDFNKIIPLLKNSGVKSAGVFGSYARDEAQPDSDVDMLIELQEPLGLFKFVGLERKLADKLGKSVDLVTKNSLHPYIKKQILSDLIIFYEQG